MNGPKGFLVILPGQMIEIPQDSHLAWLRMFYALPRELVEKRPAYLEMPRNIHRVLGSEKYRAMLQSDSFLELGVGLLCLGSLAVLSDPSQGRQLSRHPR